MPHADEPIFTLMASDPIAPFLVSIASSIRYGDAQAASMKFDKMLKQCCLPYAVNPDVTKAEEALDCAMAMFRWQDKRGVR